MKSFIVFALFVAVAVAGPVTFDSKNAEILKYESDNIGVDGYIYDVETSDGKKVSEQAVLKTYGPESVGLEVRGQYSYVGDDGIVYSVSYVADQNGFQATGTHIPK